MASVSLRCLVGGVILCTVLPCRECIADAITTRNYSTQSHRRPNIIAKVTPSDLPRSAHTASERVCGTVIQCAVPRRRPSIAAPPVTNFTFRYRSANQAFERALCVCIASTAAWLLGRRCCSARSWATVSWDRCRVAPRSLVYLVDGKWVRYRRGNTGRRHTRGWRGWRCGSGHSTTNTDI